MGTKRDKIKKSSAVTIDSRTAEALKDLNLTPFGQMALLLDHSGRLQAILEALRARGADTKKRRGAWQLLSPALQQVLTQQYRGRPRVSARTLWWRFVRIQRDLILRQAPKPLAALLPTRDLIKRGEFPDGYVDRDLRAWKITERQAAKAWSSLDRKRRVIPAANVTFHRAASPDFVVLRQLAREGRQIYIPKREHVDQQALLQGYQQRIARGLSRAVAISSLARQFHCSPRYVRHILNERNL